MKPSLPKIVAFSVWLYRWLLRIGPAEFQREYAEPASQDFRRCCLDAYQQRGTRGVIALWLPMLGETVIGLLAERKLLRLRLLWPFLVALGLILFPFSWLSGIWPAFGNVFSVVFATTRAHEVGHVTLFFFASLLTLYAFPALRHRPLLYLTLMMIGAIGEESVQALFRLQLPTLDAHDLLLDLVGMVAAAAIMRLSINIKRVIMYLVINDA